MASVFTEPGVAASLPPSEITFTGVDKYGKKGGCRVRIARNTVSGDSLAMVNSFGASSNLGDVSGHAIIDYPTAQAPATDVGEASATVKGLIIWQNGNQRSSLAIPAPTWAVIPGSNVVDETDLAFLSVINAGNGKFMYNDDSLINTAVNGGQFKSARIVGRKVTA